MTTTPAQELRIAAKTMRERAQAATRGPWEAEDDEDCWRLFGAVTPNMHPLQLIKAPKHSTPYAEYWPGEADSAFIASMHPGVALAVADWLERTVIDMEYGEVTGDDEALAVARAYLGTATEDNDGQG